MRELARHLERHPALALILPRANLQKCQVREVPTHTAELESVHSRYLVGRPVIAFNSQNGLRQVWHCQARNWKHQQAQRTLISGVPALGFSSHQDTKLTDIAFVVLPVIPERA